MELNYTQEQIEFRHEVRQWMSANVPKQPLPSFDGSHVGFEAHREWEKKLHAGGWSAVSWPEKYGGRGLDLLRWLIFEEEYYAAKAPLRVNQNGIFLLGPTLMEFGTQEQKQRFLPKMACGDEVWAQAWSEPQAGSDLAAVRAKAVRDGDHYLLSGHKIWSSRAVMADWAFGLFRTDESEKRHKGLSLILFPLTAPGVQREPIAQINGETGFAELILDEVRVPLDHRVGEEGQGWSICMATAGFERGLMLRSPGRFQATAQALVELYKANMTSCSTELKRIVTQTVMEAHAYAVSIYSTASQIMGGKTIGAEASVTKIIWSELDIKLHETALQILGARAVCPDPADHEASRWVDGYLFSLAGPIYAGSNEIQRNIIAERVLGLPRS
ncbi:MULTISPECIES: acyl-CoA dehydrogenase family protein [unclassified Pseudovibrio]|uniref:acyl-CoA dehydrogenase family protein n=1 Tax=unclassified Pseudovibrio TaxID=2627060 RepID=UPI000709085F|nr:MULTISPECIES: acyl-CoA dehydrogenase family protein [unclassified Pseudovibrio]KZL15205.1 Acyl-CoA dehydrogenase [Pseudovibrio sp. Ad26]